MIVQVSIFWKRIPSLEMLANITSVVEHTETEPCAVIKEENYLKCISGSLRVTDVNVGMKKALSDLKLCFLHNWYAHNR